MEESIMPAHPVFFRFPAMFLILPLAYLSCVRCVSQFVVPTDTSSVWKTDKRQAASASRALIGSLAALDPLSAEYPYLLAEQVSGDNPDGGLRLNRKAISLSVLTPLYQIQKGWIAAQRGRFNEAFQSFEEAIFIDPGNANAYVQQGLFLFQASSRVEPERKSFYLTMAGQSLSLAVKCDPSLVRDQVIAFVRASISNERGDMDEARAILRKADDTTMPDLGFLVRKWALQFRLGDTKAPVLQWTAMFLGGKLSPGQLAILTNEMAKHNVPDFNYFMAQIYLRKGETILALEKMVSLTSQRPHVTEYRLALGDLFEKLGKRSEALAQYERALALSPSNQYAKLKTIEHYKDLTPATGRRKPVPHT
jgi:tetratricopeptide (TPR) repeat protein